MGTRKLLKNVLSLNLDPDISCYDCPCFSAELYLTCKAKLKMIDEDVLDKKIKRPDWCPLISSKIVFDYKDNS